MGIFHALSALALGSLSLGAAPLDYTIVANPNVRQVSCAVGMGTAFQIEGGLFLSVNHVTSLGHCAVDGQPIELLYASEGLDFSVFRLPGATGKGLSISCRGIRGGEPLRAIGYAGGLPLQRLLVEHGTGIEISIRPDMRPLSIVVGPEYIPGMSGGPVLNNRGEVVGLVNAFNDGGGFSFSRSLRSTPLCR